MPLTCAEVAIFCAYCAGCRAVIAQHCGGRLCTTGLVLKGPGQLGNAGALSSSHGHDRHSCLKSSTATVPLF